MSKNIAILVGSLRDGSLNHKLAKALTKVGPEDWSYDFLRIDEVPHYDEDDEEPMPDSATRLKEGIEAADAVIIVTPEYNRSMPGVLKNAIDWASRPYGEGSFVGKPTLVAGASPGAISTAVAQQHLRNSLVYVDAHVMNQPEVFIRFDPDDLIDDEGNVSKKSTESFLKDAMEQFAEWTERLED